MEILLFLILYIYWTLNLFSLSKVLHYAKVHFSFSRMALGGGSEGGRYGSVGESGGLMCESQHSGSSNRRSGTSSSASSVVDDTDHSLMTQDVYQRQPLLTNHDQYISTNGWVCQWYMLKTAM